MFAFLFTSALKDFARARRIIPWIIVLVGVGAIGVAWKSLDTSRAMDEVYGELSSVLLFRILALCSAIFTTAIVSQEVEQKTISYLLTRPIKRRDLLLARYAAACVVVFGLGIFGAISLSIGVYGSNFASNPILMRDVMGMAFGTAAYGAVFLLVSLFINRAMLVCLLYAFGWETAIPNMPGELYYTSIFSYTQAIAQHPSAPGGNALLGLLSGEMGINTLSKSTAMTGLAVFSVLCCALAAWWFTQFEYVPREDAE
ncbi:MAG TPA: ABC transporter permease [Fimbriimonadaceae bacterium]|nr:ABC transporter permease [Fimbriimonadaceae bacterium]